MDDNETVVNIGKCSAADILQFAAEKKLSLRPYDKDMIIMMHQLGWLDEMGIQKTTVSTLIVKGENNLRTAMAKTVGLPLAIAVRLLLNGKIKTTGLHIPTLPDIYEPVLQELETHGISFNEEWQNAEELP
jgi:saccharopine dehydrogenase-like NADP-dependent oxidoreductase